MATLPTMSTLKVISRVGVDPAGGGSSGPGRQP